MPDQATNRYPSWSPRIWHGMTTADYVRMLFRNRLAMHPSRWPLTVLAGSFTLLNTVLSLGQQAFYGRKIRAARIEKPPIFIIGHWRTGTTMLHEMFAQDDQFACPSTFECFAPNHFLISERLMAPLIRLLLPKRRPMDNMAMGVSLPQEDEFAMCGLGIPTPYLRLAFPNRGGVFQELLDISNADSVLADRFLRGLARFIQMLTVRHPHKRLVLKSPPHTGRIARLAEEFPDARFLHLSRHPDQMFPSTLKLWRSMDLAQGLQVPKYSEAELQAYVLDCHRRMYRAYFDQRAKLKGAGKLVEIRFEDLIENPQQQIESAYDSLGLESFDRARDFLLRYHEARKGYKPDQVELDGTTMSLLRDQWSNYFEQFGYE